MIRLSQLMKNNLKSYNQNLQQIVIDHIPSADETNNRLGYV